MISSISSFEIINIAIPYLKTFLWWAASVTDAAAVNLNGMETLLSNALGIFFIKVLSNGLKKT